MSVQRSALVGISRPNRNRSESVSSSFSDEQDSDHLHVNHHLEGKENLSLDSNSSTPENIVCAPSLPGSPAQSQSPKHQTQHSPRGVLIASPNLLQSSPNLMMLRQLLPPDLAARLADPAAIERQNIELALRLSAAASMPESHPAPKLTTSGKSTHSLGHPQVFVKQGASKCRECNIVFCKYENYVAHKKHYCSSRITDDQDAAFSKESSPPTSPIVGSTSSQAGSGSSTKPAPTLAYQQLICAACGIKFTSLDNLSAHQVYYCPKRVDQNVVQVATAKEKCPNCKASHEPNVPCAGPSVQLPAHNAVVYKCPMCEVVSQNAADSRRHLETHSSIKAFRCSICRYRGNTLRGMRTHIRLHLEKKPGELNEEHYISCILEDDGVEAAPPVKVFTTVSGDQRPSQPVSVIAKTASYR